MNENDEKKLRDAIRQLPEHTVRPNAWEAIVRSLDAEDRLLDALRTLPEREPSTDTWERVETALAQEDRRLFPVWWQYAAAVVGLLLVAFGAHHLTTDRAEEANVVLSYHEEVAPTYDAGLADDPLEAEAWTYIEQLCRKVPPAACQRPEFVALKAHLVELSEEEQALEKALQQFGYDPQLVRYQVRIENMKADATKELIQMIL